MNHLDPTENIRLTPRPGNVLGAPKSTEAPAGALTLIESNCDHQFAFVVQAQDSTGTWMDTKYGAWTRQHAEITAQSLLVHDESWMPGDYSRQIRVVPRKGSHAEAQRQAKLPIMHRHSMADVVAHTGIDLAKEGSSDLSVTTMAMIGQGLKKGEVLVVGCPTVHDRKTNMMLDTAMRMNVPFEVISLEMKPLSVEAMTEHVKARKDECSICGAAWGTCSHSSQSLVVDYSKIMVEPFGLKPLMVLEPADKIARGFSAEMLKNDNCPACGKKYGDCTHTDGKTYMTEGGPVRLGGEPRKALEGPIS